MEWSFVFFLNSALLGVGLAMDAFSVSMANGLHDPKMGKDTMCRIAGTFGVFQAVMPMTGWICVHTIVELFSSFETFIPWIALALLGYIGGKMLVDGIKGEEAEEATELSAGALFMQGVATSIDALSVGFTISEYGWLMALAASIIHKPSVMILDEATANIDTETELLIQDSLEKMRTVGTMLIVAHRLSTIQHADNIIVLSHGKILEQGTHQQLLANHGRYYQLYMLQYHKEQLSQ